MYSPESMTSQIAVRRRAVDYVGNLIAALSLLVIGYPLAPAMIRTMLISWILIVVTLARFLLGHRFQTTAPAETLTTVPQRAAAFDRIR
jgi:predicted permease